MSQWDGNDLQLYSRFTIVVSVGCLIAERFYPSGELFAMAIFFLLVTLGMIPKGPQPPRD